MNSGPPASWSSMNRWANEPSLISDRIVFMFSLTRSSMTRGPET